MAYILTGIPTKDLYYIKSVCEKWENDNKPFGALFFKMLISKGFEAKELINKFPKSALINEAKARMGEK